MQGFEERAVAGWDEKGCRQGREGLDVEEGKGCTGVEKVGGFGVDEMRGTEQGEVIVMRGRRFGICGEARGWEEDEDVDAGADLWWEEEE